MPSSLPLPTVHKRALSQPHRHTESHMGPSLTDALCPDTQMSVLPVPHTLHGLTHVDRHLCRHSEPLTLKPLPGPTLGHAHVSRLTQIHTPGLCRHTQACPHSQDRNPRVPVPQGPCKCTSPSPLLQALPSGCRIAHESPAVGPGSKVKEIPTRQMDLWIWSFGSHLPSLKTSGAGALGCLSKGRGSGEGWTGRRTHRGP